MRYVQPYGLPDYGAGEGQPYVNGDPTIGQEGSIPPAAAFEHPMREIVNLIKNTTFVPDGDDLEQVSRGVRQQLNYAIGTGTVNNYAFDLDPPLDQYRPGLTLRIKIPVACNGASTLNINGLGSRAIKRANGADTAANDLLSGMVVELVYDGAAWQIVNFQGFTSSTVNNNTFIVDIPYVVDIGTANNIIAPFAPAITAHTPGKFLLVKVAATNTGPVQITVNGLAVRPVIRAMLTPLAPGDIIPGMIIALVYDGTSYQMISMVATTLRIMTGPQSLYVNDATGHDTNYDGRSPTVSGSTGPFKTITRAVVEMLKWTNRGYVFSIFVANGTYLERVTLSAINGAGECHLIGNDANPASVLIQDPAPTAINTACIYVTGTDYVIHGFKVQSVNGGGLTVVKGKCGIYNMEFGSCGYSQIACVEGACSVDGWRVPTLDAKIRIAGSAPYHVLIYDGNFGCGDYPYELPDLIITQSVSFSTAFVFSYAGGVSLIKYRTIQNPANVVSGKKFAGVENSIISTEGRGISYLPGPTAGTLATGAQYT